MKKLLPLALLLFTSIKGFSQDHPGMYDSGSLSEAQIFGLLELPFLLTAIVFSFLTANLLKGGKFGTGMNFLAWGFLVMALGHLHMQVEHLTNYNIFQNLLGTAIGKYSYYITLMTTWALSAIGFIKIYKASKV